MRSVIFQPGSYVERLSLAELFSASQPLEVELGCRTQEQARDYAGQ